MPNTRAFFALPPLFPSIFYTGSRSGSAGCVEGLEMAKWIFEPGHSAAEFAVRHMMVSHMRGLFKNVQGSIDFDPDNPADAAAVEATINAAGIWTGDDERDAHLRGADFLNVETYPDIVFPQHRGPLRGRSRFQGRGRSHALRCDPPGRTGRAVSGALAVSLLGRRQGSGADDPDRLRRHHGDQPPSLRRELERAAWTGAAGSSATRWRSPWTSRPSSNPICSG